jgi:hypothetical protein
MLLRIIGGCSRLLVYFFHFCVNFFMLQFGFGHPRLVPFSSGPRLIEALVVCSRFVSSVGPATLLLSMPGVALLAEGSAPAFPVVIIIGEVAPVLIPPV